MDAIVSVTADWGIGRDGRLLVRNRADMRRFKELTMGGSVIMGRKTFLSLPGGPLAGRANIVLTASRSFSPEGVLIAHGIDEALELAAAQGAPAWLIGGASLYEQLIDICDQAYVTVHDTVLEADAYFPNLDEDDRWRCIEASETDYTADGVPFRFTRYSHV